MKKWLWLICMVLFASAAQAAAITSTASGYWNDTATWAGGTIPASTDSVVISSGHTILFDRNDASTTSGAIEIRNGGVLLFASTPSDPKTLQVKGDINVYGKLELVSGSTLKIECETNGRYGIIVYSGGELKGTGSVPTVLTALSAPLNIGDSSIAVNNAAGFGIGDIITLGDGANAEGFTIAAILGNTLILNRRALNAQVAGAEVYKNATVTTSNISAGSRTFTVADLGGIKAGDRIAVAANETQQNWENQTELRTVESVASNSIMVTQAFSFSHSIGVAIVKENRDAVVASAVTDGNHNGYLYVTGSSLSINPRFVEFSFLGVQDNQNVKNGFVVKNYNGEVTLLGCSIHDCYYGIRILSSRAPNYSLISNIIHSFQVGGIDLDSAGNRNYSYLISNFVFISGYGGDGIQAINSTGGIDLVSNNIYSSYGSGFSSYNSSVLIMFNNIFCNRYSGVYGSYPNAIFYQNRILNNGHGNTNAGGLEISDDYNVAVGPLIINNEIASNNQGIILSKLHNPDFKVEIIDSQITTNSRSNINLAISNNVSGEVSLELKKSSISITDSDTSRINDKAEKVLVYEKGVQKIYGNYRASSASSQSYNYVASLYYSRSSTPRLFRGVNHTIATPETSDSTTTTEVWFVTYRSATSNWEVKGTVSSLQLNRAVSGVPYTSDNGQIRFTLTQNSPQEGDQFVFATIASAGDANTQKKILFGPSAIPELNNQSRLTVDPGAKIELKGTAEYPTLIDYDGAGSYGIVISGEVDAQHFDFNQINADGVKIDPTAAITRFDNGRIRGVSGMGSHLSVNGKDHTFTALSFDNTGGIDVRAQNDANLTFVRSQRGRFSDSIADTSSISWDDPALGFSSDNVLGALETDNAAGTVAVPFKIKDPNRLACTFLSGSFMYSTDGGTTYRSVPDADLRGTTGAFASAADFASAPINRITWEAGASLLGQEANLRVRFRVNNGFVNSGFGVSDGVGMNSNPPSVAALSPNGGEALTGGQRYEIRWNASDSGGGIRSNSITLAYTTGEGNYIAIANNEANDGSYNWTLPILESASVRVRVSAEDNAGNVSTDESDAVFSVASPPLVSVIAPNGGEIVRGGSLSVIRWAAGAGGFPLKENPITIYYSADSGAAWAVLASSEANDGSYDLTVPGVDSVSLKVRVSAEDTQNRVGSDESDANFTVDSTPPQITLSHPQANSTHEANFLRLAYRATDASGFASNGFQVSYSGDGGSSYSWSSSSNSSDIDYYLWINGLTDSNNAKIRVSARDNAGWVTTAESGVFRVVTTPSVSISSPGWENSLWRGGSTQTIRWSASDAGNNLTVNPITLRYSTDWGTSWTEIASGEANDGQYSWQVPLIDTGSGRIQVEAVDTNGNVGLNTVSFSIDSTPPEVSLTNLNSGETVTAGRDQRITYRVADANLGSNAVSLYYSTDGGATYSAIAERISNTGSYLWRAPQVNTSQAKIRIQAMDRVGLASTDESDAVFTIIIPPLGAVLSPNGGEYVTAGANYDVAWVSNREGANPADYRVNILYQIDGGAWESVAAGEANDGLYAWTAPAGINSERARIRVELVNGENVSTDESDGDFTISAQPPHIHIASPRAGEKLTGGSTYQLSWEMVGATPSTSVYYSVSAIVSGESGSRYVYGGSDTRAAWNVPYLNSDNVRLQISASDWPSPAITGESQAFAVETPPSVFSVTSPQSGEAIRTGSVYEVKWQTTLNLQSVTVDYTTNEGRSYITAGAVTNDQPSFFWRVPTQETLAVRIRLSGYDNSWNLIQAESGVFSVSAAVASATPEAPVVTREVEVVREVVVTREVEVAREVVVTREVEAPTNVVSNAAGREKIIFEDNNREGAGEIRFDRGDLPFPPMPGARAGEKSLRISADVAKFARAAQFSLPVPAGMANPRVFRWNTDKNKWIMVNAALLENDLVFKSDTMGTFAVFDILDRTPPRITNLVANDLIIASGDSITDMPKLTFKVGDDYGIDDSSFKLTVDGNLLKKAAVMTAFGAETLANVQYVFSPEEKLSVGSHKFEVTAYDQVGNAVAFAVDLYVVGSSVSGLMVYPNPYTLGGGTVKFDGLSGDVNVYLYDLSGDLVWKGFTSGAASISWDGKNYSGNAVAPGVYFYVVKDTAGNKTTGKIAVIK